MLHGFGILNRTIVYFHSCSFWMPFRLVFGACQVYNISLLFTTRKNFYFFTQIFNCRINFPAEFRNLVSLSNFQLKLKPISNSLFLSQTHSVANFSSKTDTILSRNRFQLHTCAKVWHPDFFRVFSSLPFFSCLSFIFFFYLFESTLLFCSDANQLTFTTRTENLFENS